MSETSVQLPVSREDVPGVLQAHSILPTAQRVAIAALLLSAKQHISADQVLSSLVQASVAVSKATVYNTLGLFAERGLIREVIVDPSKTFYDSNTHAHHHFYNVDDGMLIDVPPDRIPVVAPPQAPVGTYTQAVDIVIRIRNER